MTHSIELRMLPLAIGLIAFSTAIPIEVQPPQWPPLMFDMGDFIANVLLYAPLGMTLRHWSVARIVTAAAAISVSIELLQLWTITRYSSPYDVIANVGGAIVAAKLARWCNDRGMTTVTSLPLTRTIVLSAAIVVAALLGIRAMPVTPSHLSGWESDFRLMLGNETTGDRPWHGAISALAIVPSALSDVDRQGMTDLTDRDVRTMLRELHAYLLPRPVEIAGGSALEIPAEISRRFAQLAVVNNGFTVIADIITADTRQEGPARVVSFSQGVIDRNFDLGQENRDVVFRVRTPSTGGNGNDPRTEASNVLQAGRSTNLIAVYDGAIASIYVNGQPAGRTNLAAAGCALKSMCDADAPLAQAALGAGFAIIAVALVTPVRRRTALLLAFLSGIGAALSARILFPHHPIFLFTPWTDLAAVLGGLTIGWAARPADNLI